MCGIVGYVGHQNALEVTMAGLRRLEYRGYDSAGVAVVDGGTLRVERKAGKLANLEKALAADSRPWTGTSGMGHTRWATHGGPTDANAHPARGLHAERSRWCTTGSSRTSLSCALDLERRGHILRSETDTEIVAHLLEEQRAAGAASIADALRAVCRELDRGVHPGRDGSRRARPRRRRAAQLAAGRGSRGRRVLSGQ